MPAKSTTVLVRRLQYAGLRRRKSLASAETRADSGGALYSVTSDAERRPAGSDPRQEGAHVGQQSWRRILGWWVSSSMHSEFVLDALEQALYARQSVHGKGLIHHSDRGSQYVSIRYSERLTEAGIEPSVGSRGDSYDNALAETINGLYKTELIKKRAPWKTREAVELATQEWVSWFGNHHRLIEIIGHIPPAEAEMNYY